MGERKYKYSTVLYEKRKLIIWSAVSFFAFVASQPADCVFKSREEPGVVILFNVQFRSVIYSTYYLLFSFLFFWDGEVVGRWPGNQHKGF